VRGVVRSDGILLKYDGNIEHVRDGGIMLSRAGLGTSTDGYSSQPIIFDGGDSGADNDTNLRGGAIWSQWGGSQYGLAFRGANYDDVYPYPESPAMFVTKDKVGIGTNAPIATFNLKQSTDNSPAGSFIISPANSGPTLDYWGMYISSGNDFMFHQNGSDRGFLDNGVNVTAIDFTGQHRNFIDGIPATNYTDFEGLIVSANKNKYYDINEDITTGANAIQISQSLPLVALSTTVKDKACFGVVSGSEDPDTRTYEQGTFVTVLQKQAGDRRAYINSVGEGAIWVTNINGTLESGDYITTSNVVGYGQKQDSEFLANYTVAKITMDCDFEPVTQPIQQIKKDETGENILDEHGQIQWEDHATETEKAYKIRYLDANGVITDEANAVHTAAFVGCTYHCG